MLRLHCADSVKYVHLVDYLTGANGTDRALSGFYDKCRIPNGRVSNESAEVSGIRMKKVMFFK
jgi:hypothetical protein